MTHVRAVSLRLLSSRLCQQRRPRPLRLCFTRVVRIAPLRTAILARGVGQNTEFEQDTDYSPAFTESLSFALVNAFPEIDLEEKEALKPLPRNVENIADDPSLGNPLERMQRMGTGWFGVILDFEGAVVQAALESHKAAWTRLAEEESKPRPLESSLQRAAPMKAEQAISEVLCWGREPSHVRRLALRKEEIFCEITKETPRTPCEGLYRLLETLKQRNVPIAVCSTERRLVDAWIKSLGIWSYIDEVISADDVFRCAPDPEAYAFAAQKLNRPPFRCVVIGASNHSCEAAQDCGMKFVATAGTQPLYELNAADLVVKQLDELSFINLKQLFTQEEFGNAQEQDETDTEPEAAMPAY